MQMQASVILLLLSLPFFGFGIEKSGGIFER